MTTQVHDTPCRNSGATEPVSSPPVFQPSKIPPPPPPPPPIPPYIEPLMPPVPKIQPNTGDKSKKTGGSSTKAIIGVGVVLAAFIVVFVIIKKVKSSKIQPSIHQTQDTQSHTDIEMVFVQGGAFTMGSISGGDDNERPTRRVTVSNYSIGKYPVTQGQWEAIMGTNVRQQRDKGNTEAESSTVHSVGNNYPMYFVSWDEAQVFIARLNQLTGKNYRLPTEAEWEYAARGGNQSRGYTFSGSNNLQQIGWNITNSGEIVQPVGTKLPNELGIYDMSGNIWEWCNDWWGAYSSTAETNPKGPSLGSFRVRRGGSWGSDGENCRVSSRFSDRPDFRGNNIGFRLVHP